MRTLDIIEFVVASRDGIVAQEISDTFGIPASSLSYLLATLVEREYLARQGRKYLPGPGLERLTLRDTALPFEMAAKTLLRSLRAELNETCSLMVMDGWEIEARITEPSEQALRYAISVGQRKPMHSLASGKAILASLPEDKLRQYFSETTREKITPSTLTGEADLRAEFAAIRERGFALARNEDQLGVIGLACVVKRAQLSAIAVALPAVRFDADFERLAASRLLQLAAQLGS